VQLLCVALLAWLGGAFYTLRWNPETVFFQRGHALKQAWVRQLDAAVSNKIVFCGGSSCTTSVDAERLWRQHGLPAANLGMHAGLGAKVLLAYAQQSLRPGDTFLIGLEPSLLAEPPGDETLGVQFSFAIGQPALLRGTNGLDWATALASLRPGGYHLLTLLGKIALRQSLYRYALTEWQPGGWQRVAARRPVEALPGDWPELHPAMRAQLANVRDWCSARHIRVAYVLPWYYCPAEKTPLMRQSSAQLLAEISSILPVLKDPTFGVCTNLADFADTPLHPVAPLAERRTDALGELIRSWQIWSPRELAELAQAHP
jgi:hypothetical protein